MCDDRRGVQTMASSNPRIVIRRHHDLRPRWQRRRGRSRRTREDVVGILMMIVVDVPVLGSSIRWVGGSSSIRAQKRLVTLWK